LPARSQVVLLGAPPLLFRSLGSGSGPPLRYDRCSASVASCSATVPHPS